MEHHMSKDHKQIIVFSLVLDSCGNRYYYWRMRGCDRMSWRIGNFESVHFCID